MRISIIGLSGTGKTYWSKRLSAEAGFDLICCDELLRSKLATPLIEASSTEAGELGKWLGWPYEAGYLQRQGVLIDAETAVMKEVLWGEEIALEERLDNIVLDTSGSVIYTGDEIMQRLKELTVVVYFATPREALDLMFHRYISEQKPLIWGEFFHPMSDESSECAMRRCFKELYQWREERYKSYADVVIAHAERESADFTAQQLLKKIGG